MEIVKEVTDGDGFVITAYLRDKAVTLGFRIRCVK